MKMFKRGLSLLLAVVMVLSLFTVAVSADTGSSPKKPTFTVESPTGNYKKGDKFTVQVKLTNAVPFTSLQMLVEFDNEVLSLKDMNPEDCIKSFVVNEERYTASSTTAKNWTSAKLTEKDADFPSEITIKNNTNYGFLMWSCAQPIPVDGVSGRLR